MKKKYIRSFAVMIHLHLFAAFSNTTKMYIVILRIFSAMGDMIFSSLFLLVLFYKTYYLETESNTDIDK